MDIGFHSKDRTFLIAAAVALIVLGLGLSFLTWQNLRSQRETTEQHLVLSSHLVLRGIEGGLVREIRWHMRGFGPGLTPGAGPGQGRGQGRGAGPGHGMGHMKQPMMSGDPMMSGTSLMPRLKDMLDDLIQSSDVVFVSFYSQSGSQIFTAYDENFGPGPELPQVAWNSFRSRGEWAAMFSEVGRDIFVSGARTRPGLARLCEQDAEINCTPEGLGVPYLVVGLNAREQMGTFRRFKRTALLQTGYVLVMAAFLWVLAAGYMRRRDQGRKLHRLERFHSRLLDAMPDGLLTLDADGTIVAANPAAVAMVQGADNLVGTTWQDLPLAPMNLSDAPGAGPCQPGSWEQYTLGGRSLEILCMPIPADEADPSFSGEGGQRLVLVRDRTEIKALEDDLGEARKLAAIGRLAAGLAHEIRNPLSALRGFAQFFVKKLKGRDPEEQYAETMVREADRLDKVITDLLFLSRPRSPECQLVDAPALAEDLKNLLHIEMEQSGVALDLDLAEPRVPADPDMLKQAALNLMLNSLAAVSANPEGEARTIGLSTRRVGAATVLAVADNGPGMSAEQRERALEPFYTSKKEGTGLGLGIVHRIARDHGGHVEIETHTQGENRGTEVRLVFPPLTTEHSDIMEED